MSTTELNFFADPNTDILVGMVFTLAMEMSVLNARLHAAEQAIGGQVRIDVADSRVIAERDDLLNRLLANLQRSDTNARPLPNEILNKSGSAAQA